MLAIHPATMIGTELMEARRKDATMGMLDTNYMLEQLTRLHIARLHAVRCKSCSLMSRLLAR